MSTSYGQFRLSRLLLSGVVVCLGRVLSLEAIFVPVFATTSFPRAVALRFIRVLTYGLIAMARAGPDCRCQVELALTRPLERNALFFLQSFCFSRNTVASLYLRLSYGVFIFPEVDSFLFLVQLLIFLPHEIYQRLNKSQLLILLLALEEIFWR